MAFREGGRLRGDRGTRRAGHPSARRGIDHAPWMVAEVGETGLALLTAMKHTVDPTGILNPGKMLA